MGQRRDLTRTANATSANRSGRLTPLEDPAMKARADRAQTIQRLASEHMKRLYTAGEDGQTLPDYNQTLDRSYALAEQEYANLYGGYPSMSGGRIFGSSPTPSADAVPELSERGQRARANTWWVSPSSAQKQNSAQTQALTDAAVAQMAQSLPPEVQTLVDIAASANRRRSGGTK